MIILIVCYFHFNDINILWPSGTQPKWRNISPVQNVLIDINY